MKYDLLIKNGTLVTPRTILEADVAINGEKIAAISRRGELGQACRVLDAAGRYVLPGLIDIHCHLREPGFTGKEDFACGTAAAAVGGITTVFDMPNTAPPVTTPAILQEKAALVAPKAYVDFALWAAVAGNDLTQIEPLAASGAAGFKIFVGESTGSLASPDEGALGEAFKLIKKTGRLAAVHAEDRGFNQYFTEKFSSAGKNSLTDFAIARSNTSEALAIAKVLVLTQAAGNRLHIVHMSTKEGLFLARLARQAGLDVSTEVCPHYLLFDQDDFARLGSRLKSNPPVREKSDRDALWQGITAGDIDIIGSDHAPHEYERKLASGPVWQIPSGVSVLQNTVSAMLNEVNAGRLSLNKYVSLASTNPARRLGLYPAKGSLLVGTDADITIVDMERQITVQPEKLYHKQKFSLYDGFTFRGAPVATIVRGQVVALDGELSSQPAGRMIKF